MIFIYRAILVGLGYVAMQRTTKGAAIDGIPCVLTIGVTLPKQRVYATFAPAA